MRAFREERVGGLNQGTDRALVARWEGPGDRAVREQFARVLGKKLISGEEMCAAGGDGDGRGAM